MRVNVVARGLVTTEMGEWLVAARGLSGVEDPGVLDVFRPAPPADEVARVLRFLVGPDGEQVGGQRLVVNGGGVPG